MTEEQKQTRKSGRRAFIAAGVGALAGTAAIGTEIGFERASSADKAGALGDQISKHAEAVESARAILGVMLARQKGGSLDSRIDQSEAIILLDLIQGLRPNDAKAAAAAEKAEIYAFAEIANDAKDYGVASLTLAIAEKHPHMITRVVQTSCCGSPIDMSLVGNINESYPDKADMPRDALLAELKKAVSKGRKASTGQAR